MKTIKTLLIGMGIVLASVFAVNNANAQEACDSTCNTPIGLQGGYKTTKPSGSQIVHNYNDYSVRYEYQTLACPAGYQGRGGGSGAITERRAIVTFNRGNVEIGEWIALSDNCEPIPVTPPPPAHPNQESKFVFTCNSGYAQSRYLCDDPTWMNSTAANRAVATWTFAGYDRNGEPYGRVVITNTIYADATGDTQSSIVDSWGNTGYNWRIATFGDPWRYATYYTYNAFKNNVQGHMNFTNQNG